MIDKDQASKIVKRRPKRNFSSEDKKRLYTQWKTSGLKKSQFCKEKDLVLSAFAKWLSEDFNGSEREITYPQGSSWRELINRNNR